jgi:rubredoxin
MPLSHAAAPERPLDYHDSFPCPVCRYGKISTLSLMDAFACDFCRHIFTANLEQQSLKMIDSSLPLTWYWNGGQWQGTARSGVETGWETWVLATAFVIFPPALVGVSAYLFPPLPGSPLSWLPVFWTGLTFLLHLACVLWLVVEYYQFPLLIFMRTWTQQLLQRH